MKCKYYMVLGHDSVDINSPSCVDISSEISNLDELKMSYVRSDYGGVIRKCGSSVSLVGDARDRIVEYYGRNRLKSVGAFAVYSLNEDWTYSLLFECPFDFSTFKCDTYTAEIGCLDNSVAAVLKANNGTKFELPVSEIKETKRLRFDGVRLLSTARFVFAGSSVDDESYTVRENYDCSGYVYYFPPVSYAETDVQFEGDVTFHDQTEALSGKMDMTSPWLTAEPNRNRDSCFLEANRNVTLDVDFAGIGVEAANKVTGNVTDLMVSVYRIPVSGDPVQVASAQIGHMSGFSVGLVPGERLQLCLHRLQFISVTSLGVCSFRFYDLGSVRWKSTGEISYIDVVKPLSVLDALIGRMGMSQYVRGDIRSMSDNVLLVAGESIRNFSEAKLRTSFREFSKFLETVAGLVYVIEPDDAGGDIGDGGSGGDDGGGTDVSEDYEVEDIAVDADEVCRYGKTSSDLPYKEDNNVTMPDGVSLVRVEYCEDWYFAGLGSDGFYYLGLFPTSDKYFIFNLLTYEVNDDNVLFDLVGGKFYITDTPNKRLEDYTLRTLDLARYNHLAAFGGFLSGSVSDSGTFSGTLDRSRIMCGRQDGRFLYHGDDGGYYGIFPDSESYQKDGRLNPRAVFVDMSDESLYDGGMCYVAVSGNRLLMYSGTVPDLPERGSGAGTDVPGSGGGGRYVVRFVPRSSVFSDKPAKRLEITGEPSYSVSAQRIYSDVKVGYEDQEYDLGNNGRDEFNRTMNYSTGLNLREQTLDFLCPYRADSYGFQELAQKRNEDTSDTESDNNVFLVAADEGEECYKPDRSVSVSGVFTDTVFNASLAPQFLVSANERYLASFAPSLIYASSNVLEGIMIDSRQIYRNFSLENPLFREGDIKVSTNDMSLPEDWSGYVEFEWNGRTCRGFVSGLDIGVGRDEKLEYELIEC